MLNQSERETSVFFIYRGAGVGASQMVILERRKQDFVEGTVPVFHVYENFVSGGADFVVIDVERCCVVWFQSCAVQHRRRGLQRVKFGVSWHCNGSVAEEGFETYPTSFAALPDIV